MLADRYKAILFPLLSKEYDERYIILDTATGEIVDDAHGYGYKSEQKAYASFSYQLRNGLYSPLNDFHA